MLEQQEAIISGRAGVALLLDRDRVEYLSMRTRRAACEELESLLSADEIEDFLEEFRSPPATGP